MIMIYIIQACLFILGTIPFLCELSRHFYDSFLTMIARAIVFIVTIICGFYAPYLQKLPDVLLILVAVILTYLSYTTLRDIAKAYQNRKVNQPKW